MSGLYATVDCRGLSCPLPVLNTKKTIEAAAASPADFMLTVLVDNNTAAENVSRFARSAGCLVAVEQKEDGIHIHISRKAAEQGSAGAGALKIPAQAQLAQQAQDPDPEQASACCSGVNGGMGETVMLITSSTLGQGSEELGKILMRSFIFTLKEAETSPAHIYFLNSGVSLTVEGSPALEELQELAARGAEIFSCGTCLDYYQLKEKLAVGSVTNMYDIMDAILSSGRCITV